MARTHRAVWAIVADEALRLKAYGRHQSRSGSMKAMMVEAVDRALENATDEEKKIYQLRYVEGMNFRMASDKMHVSERTYYRILDQLVERVQRELA